MPPFRNGPTLAQAPALPTIPADAPPADIVRHLIDETDAAIARQTLLQIASLPDDQGTGMRARDDKPLHLTFDIPLLTAQGTAVAQLRIERDGAERSRDGAQPVWKVSFSIDVEPIGPVHARIGLVGDRASVTLKAERSESVDRLARELPSLEASLRDAALEPGRLLCHAGAPSVPTADPGRFLDHVS
jgi:flagellar hook-length control protein FliK